MSSSPSRERQLATGRDVLSRREWQRAYRALSFAEKWHIVRAVHRGRAVEEQGHARLAVRYAAQVRQRRHLNRRVFVLTSAGFALNVVGQAVSGHWLVAGIGAASLAVLLTSALLFQGSPAQLEAAEEKNRALSERSETAR